MPMRWLLPPRHPDRLYASLTPREQSILSVPGRSYPASPMAWFVPDDLPDLGSDALDQDIL